MALTPDFRKDTVVAPGTYFYLTDHTVYGTSGNPARNTLAVAMTAYKVAESLVETPMVVATYNPLTVTQFQVTATVDGWVKFYVAIIPIYTTTVTVTSNKYDVVYDITTAKYYTYINSTPAINTVVTNATYWSIIADPTSVLQNIGTASVTNNISYQIVQSINTYLTEKCYNTVAKQNAKELCDCGCEGTDTSKTSRLFTQLDGLLIAAKIDDVQQLYLAGERAMRTAQTYCDQCNIC